MHFENPNFLSSGIETGFIYPNNLKILPKTARPLVFNIVGASTIVDLLNIMIAPTPQLFVGTMKFNILPVGDGRSFYFYDPNGNISWSYGDFFPINGNREKYETNPIIFSKIDGDFPAAKYSICLFGFLFQYTLNP